ncbi:MAG: acyl-CoA reductase [Bacteroidetes bacterium]|nr:acyl-CoA reductase [Bacteroidota bacterium]MBS1628924.1 acyl-CoA reductase [Bacteroidota bacterium]
MKIQERIEALAGLGRYMMQQSEAWQWACEAAERENGWFTQHAIQQAVHHIAEAYLDAEKLRAFVASYPLPEPGKTVGIVMAGNIPLVGFHDLLCGILSGHRLRLKLSSKDSILMSHLLRILEEWAPDITSQIEVAGMLRGCDAYIATGSNNSARYFEEYFGKYPSIIRRNRTSVAILDGSESEAELQALGDDVLRYFGLGCRNVTQICVPDGYNFSTLLRVFEAWKPLNDHHKYRNNYDYHLALFLLNRVPHFDNGCLLLTENELPFSAVSVLHYRYYQDLEVLRKSLKQSLDIQSIVGHQDLPFGTAQEPALGDFADGVDTLQFLSLL